MKSPFTSYNNSVSWRRALPHRHFIQRLILSDLFIIPFHNAVSNMQPYLQTTRRDGRRRCSQLETFSVGRVYLASNLFFVWRSSFSVCRWSVARRFQDRREWGKSSRATLAKFSHCYLSSGTRQQLSIRRKGLKRQFSATPRLKGPDDGLSFLLTPDVGISDSLKEGGCVATSVSRLFLTLALHFVTCTIVCPT